MKKNFFSSLSVRLLGKNMMNRSYFSAKMLGNCLMETGKNSVWMLGGLSPQKVGKILPPFPEKKENS